MQNLLLPHERAERLNEHLITMLSKKLKCSIKISNGNNLVIDGDAYDEYKARNVMAAFGRGFDINIALALLNDEYYLNIINLKEEFKSKSQISRIKARIIGSEGKAKKYIEEASGAKVCIYGNTIGLIGTLSEIKIANTAVESILGGSTHKKAYKRMEGARRAFKEQSVVS
jgi:ribosomal RNA assembly protein